MSDTSNETAPVAQGAPVEAAPVDDTAAASDAPKEEQQTLKLFTDHKGKEPAAEAAPVEQSSEHPEWFMKDKYKSVEDQAKAYSDLNGKLGGFWGPPGGDYTAPEGSGVSASDPILKNMQPALKELGLSDKGFGKLVESYEAASNKMVVDMSAEVAKTLHEKDQKTVQVVDQWINNSFDKKESDTMKSWIHSVDDFYLLNKLRAMVPAKTNVPSQSASHVVSFETSRDIEKLKIENHEKYNKDQEYRNEISQRHRDALLREGKK